MGLRVPGVDYAWGQKPYGALQKRGIKFAMRYISHDSKKDLTRVELEELWNHGIKVGVVFESTSGRALGGRQAGADDAAYADRRVRALGVAGIPVYFAVDFDVTEAQKPLMAHYLQGAASVIGAHRVGVYGGYYAVKYCYEQHVARYFWQTAAWSGGNIHPATHIYQYKNGVSIGGLSCDLNRGRDDVEFGARGRFLRARPSKPSAEVRKRSVWLNHLTTVQRQVNTLRKRAVKLRKLLARKRGGK